MSVRQQRAALAACRRVKVARGSMKVEGGYYVVTLELECGHQAVGRVKLGRNMWGKRDAAGSLNRKKAERWAAMTEAHCIACGPP